MGGVANSMPRPPGHGSELPGGGRMLWPSRRTRSPSGHGELMTVAGVAGFPAHRTDADGQGQDVLPVFDGGRSDPPERRNASGTRELRDQHVELGRVRRRQIVVGIEGPPAAPAPPIGALKGLHSPIPAGRHPTASLVRPRINPPVDLLRHEFDRFVISIREAPFHRVEVAKLGLPEIRRRLEVISQIGWNVGLVRVREHRRGENMSAARHEMFAGSRSLNGLDRFEALFATPMGPRTVEG